MSPRSFADCTVWVTGGQRGIGLSVAQRFAALGAQVVITSRDPASQGVRESLSQLDATAQAFATAHGTSPRAASCVAWDMADDASSAALGSTFKANPPHVLVHSAHVFAAHLPIVALKPRDFSTSLATNVGGAYTICRLAGRHMARAGFGRILLVGSLASQLGGVGQASYITEKAALDGMMRAFAVELGTQGVLVNIIHPGIVDTENVRARVDAQVLAQAAQRSVAGRLISSEEVALHAVQLCDPASSAITGQSIRLSAGLDTALAFALGSRAASGEEP
jgi:NAD(P)-dependent dehydrogenase (short-subunit alcohol dehydrogenase family)